MQKCHQIIFLEEMPRNGALTAKYLSEVRGGREAPRERLATQNNVQRYLKKQLSTGKKGRKPTTIIVSGRTQLKKNRKLR